MGKILPEKESAHRKRPLPPSDAPVGIAMLNSPGSCK
jgi:hypothetical protein